MPVPSFIESSFSTKREYDAYVASLAKVGTVATASGGGHGYEGSPAVASAAAEAASGAAAASASSSALPAEPTAAPRRPVAAIIIGMAGSGKTTLMQRLNAHLHAEGEPYYMVNLDPAVLSTPFGANIDIRDTVNYKEVMKQYSLGPNGGILTALNLFATRFDQVLELIERRAAQPTSAAEAPRYALFDTPGQIEIFTWSASGAIIAESLAATFPTAIVYVVDTVRCRNAVTFMSNMLYACSILYKFKLPLILAFNKTDAQPCEFALDWMADLDAFTEALQSERSYMGAPSSPSLHPTHERAQRVGACAPLAPL